MTAVPSLPVLDAPRVRLRRLVPADIEALYEIFSNPSVTRYWSRPAMTSIEEAETLLHDIDENLERGDLFQWGVARKDADRVIGTCTLFHLNETHRRAEIGYALGEASWGRGYMHEALSALLEYAFLQLELHRLEADIDPRNAPSIRAVERFGFVQEGYLRERWHVSGEICDSVFYGLLRREWDAWRS